MDQLHQLYARSLREIQAHASESTETAEGRYFINEAAHLLAALRLWAQSISRTEQAVREILETVDAAALRDVASQLRGLEGDGKAAFQPPACDRLVRLASTVTAAPTRAKASPPIR